MRQTVCYAVNHKDENIRALSRSGGIFTAVSDIILDNGRVVYGCALNDEHLAEHRRATTKQERDSFRGSKYIQIEVGYTYKYAKQDLDSGLMVLFTGTPCQIEGLNNYLYLTKTNCSNLITMDILCHGVPSSMVWKDYLKAVSNEVKIDKVIFRNKADFGWKAHVETLIINGAKRNSKQFKNLYMSHMILRPSCFTCPYRNFERVSDITIGDFWGIDNLDKEFNDDKGVSLVMLNSDKAVSLFEKCKDNLNYKSFPKCLSSQVAFQGNYDIPIRRTEFWNEYNSASVIKLIDKYTSLPKPTILQKIKSFVFLALKKMRIV